MKKALKSMLNNMKDFSIMIRAFVMSSAMARKMRKDQDYQNYLKAQIFTSLRKNENQGLQSRTVYLAGKLKMFLPEPVREKTILCVGCRNRFELDEIEKICGCKAQGLDLFSGDARIHKGDMHAMPFADSCFDAVYSCHSLEHSYDKDTVLKEFVRVAKPGGLLVIEIPVTFTPSPSDRWDAGSVENLCALLKDNTQEVLFKEETQRTVRDVVKRDARVVIRIKK